jgi:hypothetical protein
MTHAAAVKRMVDSFLAAVCRKGEDCVNGFRVSSGALQPHCVSVPSADI